MAKNAKLHFIAMNGSFGCLPDYCDVFLDRASATEALADNLELEPTQARALLITGFVNCTPGQGADYAQVEECKCPSPHEHQDERNKKSFMEECPEFYEEDGEEEDGEEDETSAHCETSAHSEPHQVSVGDSMPWCTGCNRPVDRCLCGGTL